MEKVKVQTNKRKEKINIVGKNETSGDCSTSKKELRKKRSTRSENNRMNGLVTMWCFFRLLSVWLLSGVTRFDHCFFASWLKLHWPQKSLRNYNAMCNQCSLYASVCASIGCQNDWWSFYAILAHRYVFPRKISRCARYGWHCVHSTPHGLSLLNNIYFDEAKNEGITRTMAHPIPVYPLRTREK